MPQATGFIKNLSPVVGIGTKVLIEVNNEKQEWEIVNTGLADVFNRKMSCDAPLARQILGLKQGEKINCQITDKDVEIVIKKVYPAPISKA